ncbi:GntR family transcriptional regulator [Photorhabdus khanii]|uniref:GntR family transcriptional regulator n=1 Tax=Photorhabdus khanii subsp. guanajuatensis TaxID=2100166 RepID=A0A4R4J4C8_9GAMM|nr:GntR family transcriptional regulator [Photorhabdus khanii]TDB48384.1 GntR family transcriptional regulator [Photorhabdus khanii subsp. guanajuatensis]
MKKGNVSPQTLSERVTDTIRHKLIIGELSPGQRLSETALSEQLDISRNTLREVFRVLTQEGLLQYEPNRGVFVATPSIASIIDIYRIRRLIECQALAQSYPMHPAVEQMRSAIGIAKQCCDIQDWLGVGTANMAFHSAIVELTDSERLITFYGHISAELRLAFGYLNDPELFYAPYVDKNVHILALLETGKPESAAAALESYLEQSERTVLAAYMRKRNEVQ